MRFHDALFAAAGAGGAPPALPYADADGWFFDFTDADTSRHVLVRSSGVDSYQSAASFFGSATIDTDPITGETFLSVAAAGTRPNWDVTGALGTEYTMYCEWEYTGAEASAAGVFSVSDGGISDYAAIFNTVDILTVRSRSANSNVYTENIGSATVGTRTHVSVSFKANDFAVSRDGGAVLTNGSGALPLGLTTAVFGALYGTSSSAQDNTLRIYRAGLVKRQATSTELRTEVYTPSTSGFDVYVLMGQSNQVGFGAPLDMTLDGGHPSLWQWLQSGNVAPASNPLDHNIVATDNIGADVEWAREYLVPDLVTGRRVLLVPCAEQSTGFTANDWNEGDALYEAAVARTLAAMALPGASLKACIWRQGEDDVGMGEAPYAAALDAMIAAFRADVGETVPFLVGGMVPSYVAASPASRQPIQDALADTPTRVSACAYIDPDVPSEIGSGDGLHYSAASQRLMAARYAAAYGSL